MLRATRRVLKPGGRIAFAVIAVADGLRGAELEQARDVGPDFGVTDAPYPVLMSEAGYVDTVSEDITAALAETQAAWIDAWEAEAAEIEAVIGSQDFSERLLDRAKMAAAVREGLLRRYLVTGVVPSTGRAG